MPAYISELQPYGDSTQEFAEVALPAGTDPSGYQIQIYMADGRIFTTFPLGSPTGTMGGHDVYVIDETTAGFPSADETGNFYPDDAVALIDPDGNVVQFISYLGNTVTAVEGPASGLTSTDVGSFATGQSLQSDDGGSSYYAQSSPNSGSIPACYAPGSMIATPGGAKPVEEMRQGDLVLTGQRRVRAVRWVWSGAEALHDVPYSCKPVLIRAGALGIRRPARDLVVSGQHRIVAGAYGQLEEQFDRPYFVPAKALTGLPGVRFMAGKASMTWFHILCDDHAVVFANDLASETLLLGPAITAALSRAMRAEVSRALGRKVTRDTRERPALPSLSVGETKRILARHGPSGVQQKIDLAFG